MPKPGPKTSKTSTIQSTSFKAQPRETTRAPVLTRAEQLELRRLSALLPPSPANKNTTDMLLNAVGYIQQLEATIIARVNSGSLPQEMLACLPAAAVVSHTKRTVRRHKKRKSIEKKR